MFGAIGSEGSASSAIGIAEPNPSAPKAAPRPRRNHGRDGHIAVPDQCCGGVAVERCARAILLLCLSAHARLLSLPQRRDQPPAEVTAILIDDGDADARGPGGVSLPSEDCRENREEDDGQQERHRLRDAIAPQVRPRDAYQRQDRGGVTPRSACEVIPSAPFP